MKKDGPKVSSNLAESFVAYQQSMMVMVINENE